MATIRQLSSGNWNAQVRVKGKPAQSKTFPTEEAAQQWARQQEALTKEHKSHTIYSLGMSYCQAGSTPLARTLSSKLTPS